MCSQLLQRMPLLRLFSSFVLVIAASQAQAVSRVEIHAEFLNHPDVELRDLRASLTMDGAWHGEASLAQPDWNNLSAQLPVRISKGQLQGKLQFAGVNTQPQKVAGDFWLKALSFSDPAGVRAADNLAGDVNVQATLTSRGWAWQGHLNWRAGEMFWQPLYFAQGGHSLEARGNLGDNALEITHALAKIGGVGDVRFTGEMQLPSRAITRFDLETSPWPLEQAYPLLIKPFMVNNALGDMEMAGRLDVKASMRNQKINSFRVGLHDVDMADRKNRFAFYHLNADIPWSYDDPTQAAIHYRGGQLLGLGLGAARHQVALERYSMAAPHLEFPVLDGRVVMQDVAAALVNDQWYWRVQADVQGVSMPEFSHALGWPRMEGEIQAKIPMALYQAGKLTTNGPLKLNVFDGDIRVENLSMDQPLGLAPRLNADITLRNLDLALLTRTFSFGNITGRLDGDVKGLELSGKEPVKFDARFYSSSGNYPRKISQRAVQNISALGGAGAAAAIQRSFLRFFEEFNYQKIALSCRLRRGICEMGGVEESQSGYVMVKGSGIPSITVLGYNRNVGWKELLSRVREITQGNSKPIIK